MSRGRHFEHLSQYLDGYNKCFRRETLHRIPRSSATSADHHAEGGKTPPGSPILKGSGKKGEGGARLRRKSSIIYREKDMSHQGCCKSSQSQPCASKEWPASAPRTRPASGPRECPPPAQRTRRLTKKNSVRSRRPTRTTLNNWPKELLVQLFGYLDAVDLLVVGQVCHLWHQLAEDNVLWQRVYTQRIRRVKGHKIGQVPSHVPPLYWKSMCLHSEGNHRHFNIDRALRKIHPFTGLPSATEQLLQKSDVRWYVALIGVNNKEIMYKQSDYFFFPMSVCVRWYSMVLPSDFRIKQLQFYAANPIFFDDKGHAMPNSPCRRSLLFSIDLRTTAIYDEIDDNIVSVQMLPYGVLLARWQTGGEVAFLTANLHFHQLVERCLLGTSRKAYILPNQQAARDDIDSSYGLHGYSCTVELRNQRKSFWSEQFRGIYCKKATIAGGSHAVFVLIDPEETYSHPSVDKQLSVLWKTEALRGTILEFCILDFTLLDEHKSPIWCFSNGAKLTSTNAYVSYATDGEAYSINYTDHTGKVLMTLIWEEESRQYHITKLEIHIALCVINRWFGRRY